MDLEEMDLVERSHAVVYCWSRFNINRCDIVLREMFKKPNKNGMETIKITQEEYDQLEKELSKGAPTKQDIRNMCIEHNKQRCK
jgi:hypothetical protein